MSHDDDQGSHGLKKARREAEKLGVPQAARHLFFCGDLKRAKCAGKREMLESWKHLKKRLKALRRESDLKTLATPAYCFDVCKGGPILLVYPDGVWYGAASPDNLDRIVDEHLLGGRVVEDLVLSRTPEGPCGWGGQILK